MADQYLLQSDPNTNVNLSERTSAHEPLSDSVSDGSVPSLKGWPTEPARIKKSWISILADLATDFVLLAMSIVFLAFGIVVDQHDQVPAAQDQHVTDTLLALSKLGPSIFPILFACVVGRTTHAVLVYRLERGESVGMLDMLAGSTSLTSTVLSQLQLRIVTIVGPILVLIWALSPVGGQASIRQISIGTATTTEQTKFNYAVHTGYTLAVRNSDRTQTTSIFNALFVSSLLAPLDTRLSARDTWGNVKIPMIETFENTSSPDSEGWFNTSSNSSSITYSSLVGIPIANITRAFVDYAIGIETQYLHLDCPVVVSQPSQPIAPKIAYNGTGANIWSFDNATERYFTNLDDLKPRNFTCEWSGGSRRSECLITTTYVEARVVCLQASNCAVDKLRRSRLSHRPSAFTLLDGPFFDNPTIDDGSGPASPDDIPDAKNMFAWDSLASCFVTSTTGRQSYPTPVQKYLTGPDNPQRTNNTPSELPPNPVYAVRLGQMMNTYWTLMNFLDTVASGITPTTATNNRTMYDTSMTQAFFYNAEGTKSTKTSVIECNRPWNAILCISSVLLILASLARLVIWFFFIKSPEIMLNVSSLAMRDSPYVALSQNGSFMDASERAMLLKNTRVKLGDVQPVKTVGRLAIMSVDALAPRKFAHVQKGRLYE